ncbi:hypothetical protein D3C85_354640 [compost metagenome]
MADAARLANHQVGRRQARIEQVGIVFQAAVVVGELRADPLDQGAVGGDIAAASAHAQDALVDEADRHFQLAAGRHFQLRRRWWRDGGRTRLGLFQFRDLLAQFLFTLIHLRQAFDQARARFQRGDGGLQLRQFRAQAVDHAVLADGLGTRAQQHGFLAFQLPRLFHQCCLAALLQLGQFVRQARVFFLQGRKFSHVGTHAGAGLVLDHVQVAAHLLFQLGIAARVRQAGPESARHVAVGDGRAPQLRYLLRRLGAAKAQDHGSVAAFEFLLQRFGQAVARAAFRHGAHVHFVVVGQYAPARHLAHQLAQVAQWQTHADQRAMAGVRQFPQPAAARSERGRFRVGVGAIADDGQGLVFVTHGGILLGGGDVEENYCGRGEAGRLALSMRARRSSKVVFGGVGWCSATRAAHCCDSCWQVACSTGLRPGEPASACRWRSMTPASFSQGLPA